MVGTAWLTLRQAQEALKNGRLEEAHRLLCQPSVQGHKRSWELLQQVARGFLTQGERCHKQGDPVGAWRNLLLAEQVGVANRTSEQLRQALTRQGLTEIRVLLEAGEPRRAAEAIALLRERSVRLPEVKQLEDLATNWAVAEELAGRGEFACAIQTIEKLRRLWPGQFGSLEGFQKELEKRRDSFSELLLRLHEALNASRWREVVQLSDQVLALAPQHAEARRARSRAWQTIEPATVAANPRAELPAAAKPPEPPQRYLLWIDGVGGYLICLANRVTVGQATPEMPVDVPLFADISRLHATLTRDTEGYLLEGVRSVRVNGEPVEKALLQSGDRVTLGTSCQLQFMQPVPVSATARLDLVSGHRLPLAVDGVILMADTLVMGPGTQVHIAMPDLEHPVVLFRHKDGLGVRCRGNFSIDGQKCQERGNLGPTLASVTGDDFALAVESVGMRLGRS